ncbi:MAG: hypothetical protein ABMA64_19920 [Myxococcota bacterium]
MVWLVWGCGGGTTFDESTPPPEGDADTDADADADSDTDADTDADPGELAAWVVTSIAVAGRFDGFDLDGDGDGDNALWAMKLAVDPALATALTSSTVEIVVQLADVHDWQDDPAVRVGVLSAEDPEGDGTFDAGPSVDATGAALVAVETPLAAGAYEVVLADDTLVVGAMTLEASTPIHVAGEPTAQAHPGRFGCAIPIDRLLAAFEAAGVDPGALEGLDALADLDTDQDDEPDSISAAFAFDAAPALIAR